MDERTVELLIKKAISARENSYSPYSKFKVGASLLCKNGKIFTGCNIENSSFTPTVCAERVAIFKAVSEGIKSFEAICIVGDPEKLTPPCGVCRQVMSEFESDLTIILANLKGDFEILSLKDLLPRQFNKSSLINEK